MKRRRGRKKGSKNNPRRAYISAHTYYAAVFGQDFVLTGRVDLIANAKDYVGGSVSAELDTSIALSYFLVEELSIS